MVLQSLFASTNANCCLPSTVFLLTLFLNAWSTKLWRQLALWDQKKTRTLPLAKPTKVHRKKKGTVLWTDPFFSSKAYNLLLDMTTCFFVHFCLFVFSTYPIYQKYISWYICSFRSESGFVVVLSRLILQFCKTYASLTMPNQNDQVKKIPTPNILSFCLL